MERVISVFAVGAWMLLGTGVARAEVVLAPSESTRPFDDGYASSRFGHQPAPVVPESTADVSNSRKPAGLIFEDDFKNAGTATLTQPQPQRTRVMETVTDKFEPMARSNDMHLVPDSTKGVQEISVIAGELGFFPKTVFVTRDIPVRMYVTGSSKETLCIMMDSFRVQKQVRTHSIEEISFTPNLPGKYRFYCPINGMEGTLVVREFSTPSP